MLEAYVVTELNGSLINKATADLVLINNNKQDIDTFTYIHRYIYVPVKVNWHKMSWQ